jgi:DNA-binding HxlR family transcriptional regulator
MRWSEIGDQPCSVAKTLAVIGDRWTMLVLREAFLRTRRFDEFQRNTGAPRPVLAERLRKLVEDGVLERRPYGNHPDRYEYRLTEMGIDLYPVLVSLVRFGDRWLLDGEEPMMELRHSCGEIIHPELACPECGEWIDAHDMSVADPSRLDERIPA